MSRRGYADTETGNELGTLGYAMKSDIGVKIVLHTFDGGMGFETGWTF